MSILSTVITQAVKSIAQRTDNTLRPEDATKIAAKVNADVKPVLDHLTNNEPWYQSRVTWGAIIAIASPILGLAGVQADIIDPDEAVQIAVGIGSVVGGLTALVGRWVARKPIGA